MEEVSMRSTRNGGLVSVAILTVGLVLSACGSSNNSTTTTALTKAQFLTKGNAICKHGNVQITKAAHQQLSRTKYPNGPPPQAVLTKFATVTLIPTIQSEINGIKALGAPSGDQAKVTAIVTSAQAALDKGKANPTLVIQKNSTLFANANKLSKAYGLTACGGGGGGNG
jgi:hypothetical protein